MSKDRQSTRFFRFPPHFMTEETVRQIRVRKERRRIYENLDAIVIDEASMVRADILDAINWFLQKYGPKKGLAFGGVQIILVGDLFQLPPIVGRQEQQYFHQVYKTPYFFSAKCYNAVGFQTIQLSTIFRQHDDEFITILNKIRNGDMDKETLDRLNRRVGAVVKGVNSDQPPVTLATTNKVVTEINHSQLDKIPREAYSFRATTKGNFPNSGSALPCPGQLNLKQGARVMFVKNGENWVNGSLGKVVKVDDKQIGVKLDRGGTHIVTP